MHTTKFINKFPLLPLLFGELATEHVEEDVGMAGEDYLVGEVVGNAETLKLDLTKLKCSFLVFLQF